MLPFLELSKSLAKRGHKISYITTPKNLQRLPKPPPELSHNITFISFNLPPTQGLRDAAEATTDIPPEEIPYLKKALDGLEQPFADFIKQAASPKPVDWIIQDFAQHWIPALGIPSVCYIPIPAAAMSFFGGPNTKHHARRHTLESLTVPPPWVPFPSKVAYRLHEARKMQVLYRDDVDVDDSTGITITDKARYDTVMEHCKLIAIRSCFELESAYLNLIEQVFAKDVLPIGLLPPTLSSSSSDVDDVTKITGWLDKHHAGSVIYVALGSEVAVSIELLHELALGLELARIPFVWGLRRPFGLGEDVDMLPPGFEDRTGEYGIVVKGWAPQIKILAHESVGGFLTHCGWSSIVEGLHSGLPLVMLPVILDQGLNARLMEEIGVGVEVAKNEEDGSFTRDDVARAVKLVMVEEEGEMYRKKAEEMKAIMGLQEKYVEGLSQYLASHKMNKD